MKRIKCLAAWLLAGTVLAGCAKTPDQAVVREKGEHGVEGYQEDTEDAAGTEESGAGAGTAGGQSGAHADTPERGALAQKLQTPERYQADIVSPDGKFELKCDAEVCVPDVEKVPVYQVSAGELTQEWMERVKTVFFGDAPVYDPDYLYARTKTEVEEKLNKLKGFRESGDPFAYFRSIGVLTDDMSEDEAYAQLQIDIDALENEYSEAPETKEKKEIPVTLAGDGQTAGGFYGYVEAADGNYLYRVKSTASMPMEIVIRRSDQETVGRGGTTSFHPVGVDGSSFADAGRTYDEMEAEAGITKEEAAERVNGYLKALGLAEKFACSPEVILVSGDETDFFSDPANPQITVMGYGWQVDCTRILDGFPVTSESNTGGAVESMESTVEPWCYEKVKFIVGKDGLLEADILNLYEVGEQRMENVQMLPFPEIAGIFEQMMQIKHADMTGLNWVKCGVSRVTLGYMRIYDPTVDHRTGTLVPVWDFFGSEDVEQTYEGETGVYHTEYGNASMLTINAADGTVIDRSLGY